MEKVKEMSRGSTSVDTAISTLIENKTVKINSNLFKKVVTTLRTNYSKLIEDQSVTLDYSNFEITLN